MREALKRRILYILIYFHMHRLSEEAYPKSSCHWLSLGSRAQGARGGGRKKLSLSTLLCFMNFLPKLCIYQ